MDDRWTRFAAADQAPFTDQQSLLIRVNHYALERIDRAFELRIAEIGQVFPLGFAHRVFPALEHEHSLLLGGEGGADRGRDAVLVDDLFARYFAVVSRMAEPS